jgi:hypothetical protein
MGVAVGDKIEAALAPAEPFDGQFAVNDRDHNVAVAGFDGPVHDQEVAIVNTCPHHRVAARADVEGGGGVLDKVLVEVEVTVNVVVGG